MANTSTSFPQIPTDPADAVLYAQGSIIASNEIHASGNLRLMNSSGDEGGEIFLNKSVTNTTLNGGVTIDVFQNRLRFFEQGGTARGYYLDISNGGGGVATNLGASSASPGGSDTHVQFNDAGSFGGQNTFKFNKTTGEVTVNRLFVTGVVGGSIVTSGAIQVKDSGGTIVVNASDLGTISGSSDLQIGGNITGSNILVSGDLAVNGGDLTSTSTTFNLFDANVGTLNVGPTGAAFTMNIGRTTNVSTTNIATGGNSVIGATKNVNIGTNTAATAICNVNIGSSGALGKTTLNQDVFLTTGNLIGAPGTGANVMTLISSGNIIAKLDTDASAAGHKFAVVDSADVDQFRVFETGNAEVRGDLVVSGSSILTTTTTTYNLLNTTLTGTLNVGGAATSLNLLSGSGTNIRIGAGTGRTTIFNDLVLGTGNVVATNDATPISLISSGNVTVKLDTNNDGTGHKFSVQDWRNIDQFSVNENGNADVSGSLVVSGTTTIGATVERMTHFQTTGSVIAFDMTFNSVFYVNNPNNDITANFTSLSSVVNNRVVTPTIILSQSATGRVVSTVQVDGVTQTLKWANGVTPIASANKQEVFGFSLIRSGSNWNVLGQMTSYG